MSRQTQADLLIETLAALRDAQCERDAARLRAECKAHAQRFIEAFRPDLVDGAWIPQGEPAADAAMSPVRDA